MLALQAVLVAAAALAGQQAHAHSSPNRHHLQSRNIYPNPFKHGHLFLKRQSVDDFGSSSGDVLEACTEQCEPYIEGGTRCAGLEEGGEEGDKALTQEAIMACACEPGFMRATIACMQCTPKTFESSDGYNGKTILSTALAQCECIGHKVEGVDISVLPGEDEGLGESILKSCGSGSGVTTKGPIPIDEDNDSGKGSSGNSASSAQDDNKGAVQSGSSGAGTLASKPAGTGTPAAATGGIGANPKSPTSSSTPSPAEAQSTTGAASIIQVQHILALLMAGMISSILL